MRWFQNRTDNTECDNIQSLSTVSISKTRGSFMVGATALQITPPRRGTFYLPTDVKSRTMREAKGNRHYYINNEKGLL